MATAVQPQHTWGTRLASILPILGWIRTYDTGSLLRPDVLAGVTVAAFSVPESMAYAGLAGLSPEIGLYASMLALFVYAFFGTSRQLSVGTTSALAIMVGGSLGALTFASSDDYLAAAQLTAIFAGIIAIVAGLLRLGFVVNFISESVLTGFSAGAALFIGSSQLSKLFGVEGSHGNFFDRVWTVIKNLGDTNWWTLALGITSIVLLLVFERLWPRLPTSLFVVVLAVVLMYVTNLEDKGVAVAGHIPAGLPRPRIPTVDHSILPTLFALAFGCFLLSYIEGVSCAETFAARHKERIDADQELFANGAINLGAGLFRGFPVGGSMSRSAVNDSAGAKTPLAGAFAAILLAIVLLVLTAPFEKLPEATLAAVVLVAVKGLVDIPAIRRLWRLSRIEFAAAALTFAGVLTFDLLKGVLIGAAFSVGALVWRVSKPHTVVLGRIPGSTQFADVARHPENEQVPGVLVTRVDDDIFYANTQAVKDQLFADVEKSPTPVRLVVLDLSSTPLLDLAGIDMIDETSVELRDRGAVLRVVGASGEVRDALRRAGVDAKVGPLAPGDTVEQIVDEWAAHPQTTTTVDGVAPAVPASPAGQTE
jgi:high affinity sulfate transporter 1